MRKVQVSESSDDDNLFALKTVLRLGDDGVLKGLEASGKTGMWPFECARLLTLPELTCL